MNADQLLEHFHRIGDAPDAIPRLRRFVLDLAVRGKLVPQDPNDEPASELLNRLASEKIRLARAKRIALEKPLTPLPAKRLTIELPAGWEWVQLGGEAFIEPLFRAFSWLGLNPNTGCRGATP